MKKIKDIKWGHINLYVDAINTHKEVVLTHNKTKATIFMSRQGFMRIAKEYLKLWKSGIIKSGG